ncbi:MAG: hypothetical protein IPI67_41720 [Myxococcales bacterium]|nr:hypothetical protein [Myxococcales bacterium]
MTDFEDHAAKLARLAAATEALAPPSGLADRVMLRVEREKLEREPWGARGIVLGLFAAAAALSIWVSSSAQSELDRDALSSFDVVELEQ